MPFYLTESDKRELRDISQVFFEGGHPDRDPEIKTIWSKWKIYFESFMLIIDARYGNLLHLPYSGGILEQPYREAYIYLELQGNFREHLQKEADRALKKAKSHR